MSHKRKRQNEIFASGNNDRWWDNHDSKYMVEFGGQPNCLITCRSWLGGSDAIKLALRQFGFSYYDEYVDCYPGCFEIESRGYELFKINTKFGVKELISVYPAILDDNKKRLARFLEHAIVAPTVQAIKHCGCKFKYRDLWFCSDFGKMKIGK